MLRDLQARFEMHSMKRFAVLAIALASLLTFAGAAYAAPVVRVDRHTIRPGQDASWMAFDTTRTEIYPRINNGAPDKHATIRWERGGKYAGNRETFMLLGFRLVRGAPHRMFNGHNHPGDAPYGWTPPACSGGPRTGISPFAIDYQGDWRGLHYTAEPQACGRRKYHFRILSRAGMEARRGRWVWLWVDIVWGRRSGPRPGSVKIWVAGEARPRVNVRRINTHYPGQGMVTFWSGTYWPGGAPTRAVVDIAVPHFGHTPLQAYRDRRRSAFRWGSGSSARIRNTRLPGSVLRTRTLARACANGINGDPSEDPLLDGRVGRRCISSAGNSDVGSPPVARADPPPWVPYYRSNVNDGDIVRSRTRWNVTVLPAARRVELWADDRRLADCRAATCSTPIDPVHFSPGAHRLGIVYTLNGRQRVSFGTGGVTASIAVEQS
jgi:hypothetical protein